MELKNQVCSLELSKKLKELGFKQESLFYWEVFDGEISNPQIVNKTYPKTIQNNMDYFHAYTVAELGEMLPIQECIIEEMVEDDEWYIKIEDGRLSDIKTYQEIANTEADARAKMLIFLKENNLI